MEELPEELLIVLFGYLDFKALCRLAQCCWRLEEVCGSDLLWAKHCQNQWNIKQKENVSQSWKEVFREQFVEWGRYLGCYRRIRECWDQIFAFTRQNAFRVFQSLKPGISDKELDQIEKEYGLKFPLDFRCSYRICNGQEPDSRGGTIGVFGTETESETAEPERGGVFLWSLKTVDQSLSDSGSTAETYEGLRSRVVDPIFIPAELVGRLKVVPMTVYNYMHSVFGVLHVMVQDVTKESCKGGIYYSLFPQEQSQQRNLLGKYAENMTEFLERQMKNLQMSHVYSGRYLRFTPNNTLRTGPFKVDVSVVEQPAYNHNLQFFFGYRITLSMDPEASECDSCQLETRHWTITDASGQTSYVNGPGVVGEFPIMRPGASHSWISGTNFRTEKGTMNGHFKMRNLRFGNQVRIDCAQMTFTPDATEIYWLKTPNTSQIGSEYWKKRAKEIPYFIQSLDS